MQFYKQRTLKKIKCQLWDWIIVYIKIKNCIGFPPSPAKIYRTILYSNHSLKSQTTCYILFFTLSQL